VFCRTPQSQGEREIYWKVIGDEIYGTTKASKASTFYIKCNKEQSCCIIHKTDAQCSEKQYKTDVPTQHFATVQRPFLTECPLKLVSSNDQENIFILINTMKQPVTVPQTEEEWKRWSPFFIYLPAGGRRIIGSYSKPQRYINVRKIIEEWKKTTTSSDADSKGAEELEYSTGSSASLDKPGQHVITTQFYFISVVNIQGNRVTDSGGPPSPPCWIID
jgi:hypothetical protein